MDKDKLDFVADIEFVVDNQYPNADLVDKIQNRRDEALALIQPDSDIDFGFYNQLPLRAACVRGDLEVVAALLTTRTVVPTIMHNYPLRAACSLGHIDVVQLLLQQDRVPEDLVHSEFLPLYEAVENGHFDCVRAIAEEILKQQAVDPVDTGDDVRPNWLYVVELARRHYAERDGPMVEWLTAHEAIADKLDQIRKKLRMDAVAQLDNQPN